MGGRTVAREKRLLAIRTVLHDMPMCPRDLAERFDVSVRTIYEDLRLLRDCGKMREKRSGGFLCRRQRRGDWVGGWN